ncbi:MAG TPA: M48 family metallopeptidase [Pirellulaceae bacterium]|jgi:predicted Zn-dependent protease|nr:M48 family metallopeptidase [Pirellulaceae bacterium]
MSTIVTFSGRLQSKPVWIFAALTIVALPPTAAGQQRQPFPFSDPQRMFEQFFGAVPAEDREKIDKITISARNESQIGERASRQYIAELRRKGIKVITRGKDVEYLRKLVALVRPKMENASRYKTIRVYLAESNETDARSFPGGTLVFYRGMLEFAENEASLIGVIGHELSHLDHGHQLYDAKRVKLMQSTFSGTNGFSPDQFFRSGAMLMRSFGKPFRPEDESVADNSGAVWAYELGYDPREMAKLFLRMHERDRGAKANLPAFLRTHPYHLDRYKALTERFKQLQADKPNDNLYLGAENIVNRIPRSEKEF